MAIKKQCLFYPKSRQFLHSLYQLNNGIRYSKAVHVQVWAESRSDIFNTRAKTFKKESNIGMLFAGK